MLFCGISLLEFAWTGGMARSIFITGAASGIGLATAKCFSELGDNVALVDISETGLARAAREVDGPAITLVADVRDELALASAFRAAVAEFGRIDVLHANAGVSSMKRAVDLTEDDWNFNFDVNAKGVFLSNKIAVKHFLTGARGGVIVNTASLAAKVGAPFLAHYSASKFAVVGWTQVLAREHAKDGIRVNAVCPGFVATPMQDREIEWEADLRRISPEDVLQSYVDQTPLGRLETPEDVAGVVRFLASEEARFMTGQAINVTGGVYMG